ncbi:hypothetical protein [Hydrogenophaga sp.]|uniref:hypothetical protein n=1 Tax=Hydrogenophaga sp. TaxID=1904254 RepID=UPI002C491FB3|nr:hypothetical protein [Hydrogenophaga sp.]HMP09712.1 hypothetical protein [Hydrogenophaga sp.]
MSTTTFGYDTVQDRIWMRSNASGRTVWLTRRMVAHLLGPVLQSFEAAAPGAEGGAPPATRAALEHELALHEPVPGGGAAVIRTNREPSRGPSADLHGEDLCTRIMTTTTSREVTLQISTTGAPLTLRLSRRGMHLWLQGLVMVLRRADWNLPQPLPGWLQTGVLPPAVRAILPPQPPV